MEIILWEMTWRIQESINGSFGKSVCCKVSLKLDATKLLSVRVSSSGLVRKLPRSNIGRTSRILIDGCRGFPQPLEAKDWY
jgi:hypothetical protein